MNPFQNIFLIRTGIILSVPEKQTDLEWNKVDLFEIIKRAYDMSERPDHFTLSKHKSSFFETKYIFCMFVILVLSLVDGTMTIFLVEKGAWEANPFMRYALEVSHEFFFFTKYFLTASGLLFLLMNGTRRVFFNIISLEEIAGGLVLFYEGLIIYEITIYHLIQ